MSLPTIQQLIEEKDGKTVVAKIIIGGTELPVWNSCSYQFDIGQVPTATITIPGLANVPASVQEEASVQIWFGYKVGVTTLTQLVFGGAVVDSIGNNGSEITITCVMIGPRKLSYSYNRRIAFDFDNVVASTAIISLLEMAGVANYSVDTNAVTGLGGWIIGTQVPYTAALGNQIQFSSFGDAVNKVAEVYGSPWYAMPSGQVRVEVRDAIPSPSARRTYFASILTGPVESQPLGIGNPLARPRITDISKNQNRRDVANSIIVDGAVVVTIGPNGEQNSEQIQELVDGASGSFPNGAKWIPTPPTVQDFTFSNELIDTNVDAFQVAERYYNLKNRLFEDLPITVPGDPDVFLGETVAVKDPMYSGTESLYFVKGYTTTIEQNSCTTTLQLTGGPEAGTTGFASPFADFIWTYDANISPGGNGGPGGDENPISLPPNTDVGAKLCEDFPDQTDEEGAGDEETPGDPEEDASYASDAPGNAVVYIGLNGTISQDFDGYIVSWIWTWTDHLSVVHTVSGPRWTLIINPEDQSSVEIELTVTDNSGRTDSITKTVRTSVNYVPNPSNPNQDYDPTDGEEDTGEGGGTSIGPCTEPEPEFVCPYPPCPPGDCNGLEKSFLVAAKTLAMASLDNRTWNDLTKVAADVTGDFISVDGGVNNATQVAIAIFGTSAGEIVRSIDNCENGDKVFTVPGGPRIECIHFDTQEMGAPGGDIPEASETPSNGEVPVYTFASPGTLTIAQAYQQARLVGFSHDTAIVAVGIMRRESGLYSKAMNTAGNTPPSTDRGIAQWNSYYWGTEGPPGTYIISDACAYNTECAIREMYKQSAGGSNWQPWNVRGGSHLTGVDLSAVQAVVGAMSGDAISPNEPNPNVGPSSMKIWAGTDDGRIYVSSDSGKTWTLHVEFADGSPILQIGTPAGPSLWAFGGDTGEISSLVRIDPNKTGIFVSLDIQGDLKDAILAAGAGSSVRSSTNDTASILVFTGGLTERVWTSPDPLGDPTSWIPCGVTSGTFHTVAPGFGGDFVIAGSTVMKTRDNENFTGLGAGPGVINHMIWRGLPGMYTCALDIGLYQTVDFGDAFGPLRPNAAFSNTWPAGAEAKQVAVSMGARRCEEPTPAACIDAPRYEAAAGVQIGPEYFTNDQKLSNSIVGASDDVPDTALITTYYEGNAHINNLGKESGSGSSLVISVEPTIIDSFLFIAVVSREGDEPDSVTDSQSLTWEQVQTELRTDDVGDIRLSIYRTNANADSVLGLDITVAFPATQSIILAIVDEWIGLDTAPGDDPVVNSTAADNTDSTPTDFPADYLLEYTLPSSSASFDDGSITPPSFGIALQLAACGGGGMFIVQGNDLFSFDGSSISALFVDDPALNGVDAWALKSLGGKLFWHAENNPGAEGIVARSEDAGVTAIAGGSLAPLYISHFDVAADGTLYAIVSGATDAIYKSVDNGDNWTSVLGLLANNTYQGSIACHPTDANRIAFLALSGGVSALLKVSTNAGSSFGSTLITEVPATGFNAFFGFQPRWLASGRLAWAFHEDFGDLYVMYSDDDGASVAAAVSLMAFGVFSWFHGMWVNDNVLYLAAMDVSNDQHIFRSTNEGVSWTDLGVIGANGANIQGVAFNGDNMYVVNDAPEMWVIASPATTWSPTLVTGSFPYTPVAVQDGFVTMVT